MIVITGAAGFIASCLVGKLNRHGHSNLVLVDDFSNPDKEPNYIAKKFLDKVHRNDFFEWLEKHGHQVDFIYHLGARTDTTEFDHKVFDHLNVAYSKKIWQWCAQNGVPLVYASSAATYGLGEHGYDDRDELAHRLKPLNPYGESKNEFDKWAIEQTEAPPHWKGVKFFNVFGPNEYHKGRMASVVFHAFRQISETKKMRLFRSHHPDFEDGKQMRDFVYVKDVEDVLYFMLKPRGQKNGLYNLGSGKARTFVDLAVATFNAMGLEPNIEFVDTPEDIRDKYQYFTEAHMDKLRQAGFDKDFTPLEDAVRDYVVYHLMKNRYW